VYFAALRSRRRGITAWTARIAPALAALLLAAILVLTVQHFDLLLGVAPTSAWRYTLPGSFAVAAILGVLRAGYLRAARPDVYEGIGHGSLDPGSLRTAPADATDSPARHGTAGDGPSIPTGYPR